MRFHFRTLGCRLNQLDSARLTGALLQAGHQHAPTEAEADVVFVNSCAVTAQAERKSRQAARGAARRAPRVAVFGCGPAAGAAAWRQALPQALVFESERALLAHFGLDGGELAFPVSGRTRVHVAIQGGCDDTCAFCITRIARGRHHSLPLRQVIEQVRAAEDQGVQEVVLTGVNLAAWGAPHSKKHPDQARLHDLLEALLAQTRVPRIRLSSLGPQYLQAPFFDLLADARLCAYLHLSVQSGSPRLLALEHMNRGHGTDEVQRIAERARAVRPEVALSADFITGFPGESEADFELSCALARAVGFAKLHVFPFSERPGTRAARLPEAVPHEVRRARAARLRSLGEALRAAFLARQWGRVERVLVEGGECGLTGNYIRMQVPGGRGGEIHPLRLQPQLLREAPGAGADETGVASPRG